ncbi:hypothetical protein GF326_00655 [Candidatus Bathyarchaeota archaeon]|nr:hypothetical protein [Candidatus Bathyarchaeota archaeon]
MDFSQTRDSTPITPSPSHQRLTKFDCFSAYPDLDITFTRLYVTKAARGDETLHAGKILYPPHIMDVKYYLDYVAY